MKKLLPILTLIIIIVSSQSSCKKEDTRYNINIDAMINGQKIVANKYYKLNNRDSILISRLDYYLQNLDVNDINAIKGVQLYSLTKSPTLSVSTLVSDPPVTVNSMVFLLGLDSAKNETNPNAVSVDDPLSGQNNMYWTAWTKYRYSVLEGSIKTPTGILKFSYHAGLAYRERVEFKTFFGIGRGDNITSNIHLNVNKIFLSDDSKYIDYENGELEAHTLPAEAAFMAKYSENFSKAFTFE